MTADARPADVSPTPEASARRVLIIGRLFMGFVTVGLALVLLRTVQLQVHPPGPIAVRIDSQRSNLPLHPRRGSLEDRVGRKMAVTQVEQLLFVDPKSITDPGTFSERVGGALGYDPAAIERHIAARPNRRYVVIDRELSDERALRMAHLKVPGLATADVLVRRYPHQELAGQLLGGVGADGAGLEGLERSLDRNIRGVPGRLDYLRDARRRPLWIDQDRYQNPHDGQPIRLSIDLVIQAIAEAELRKACQQYGAQSGQMVVMDPYTGQVLAMANYPSYDPNDIGASTPAMRRNRCVTDAFEPGSIFKPFVWSAAIEGGLVRPNERIDCENGLYVTSAGRRLHDAHPYGYLTVDEILELSSNIGMAKIGERLATAGAFQAITAFGFGRSTGSGLAGESPGIVNPLPKWSRYTISSVPMGQEVAVTPIQIARAFSAIANGGMLVKPSVLAPTRDFALAPPVIVDRIMTPATAQHTRETLRRAVTQGTGRKADSQIYEIFGKTGTAQAVDPNRRGYVPDAYVASFVAGAPLVAPRIVVACHVHRPDKSKGHFGGTVAAPAVMNVIEQTLSYMGVPTMTPDRATRPAVARR